jgi:hypothetical protein
LPGAPVWSRQVAKESVSAGCRLACRSIRDPISDIMTKQDGVASPRGDSAPAAHRGSDWREVAGRGPREARHVLARLVSPRRGVLITDSFSSDERFVRHGELSGEARVDRSWRAGWRAVAVSG